MVYLYRQTASRYSYPTFQRLNLARNQIQQDDQARQGLEPPRLHKLASSPELADVDLGSSQNRIPFVGSFL